MRATAPAMKPSDVWDVLTAGLTGAGSIGKYFMDNYTVARASNLDNIDANLRELFYEHFATMLDDDPDMVVSGTVTTPDALFDNAYAAIEPVWDTINEYVDFTFEASAYIKRIRHYGHPSTNGSGRFKLQAYVAGAWEDCLIDIVPVQAVWSSWLNLTTPRSALRWRLTCTTVDTGSDASVRELELDGVKIG